MAKAKANVLEPLFLNDRGSISHADVAKLNGQNREEFLVYLKSTVVSLEHQIGRDPGGNVELKNRQMGLRGRVLQYIRYLETGEIEDLERLKRLPLADQPPVEPAAADPEPALRQRIAAGDAAKTALRQLLQERLEKVQAELDRLSQG